MPTLKKTNKLYEMLHNSKYRFHDTIWALFICLALTLLYLYTLAPTVLWGDDAYFQRVALTGELRPDGGGHWLWLQLAQLFVRLPWGDVAYRSNLLSAVAASATLLLLYAAGRQAGLRREAATLAVVSLGIGHTFWMHAVRAEVYTLFTLFVAVHLWLWARWRPGAEPTDSGPGGHNALFAGAGLFGLTLLAHQMALFLLPAWALLIWRRRRSLERRQAALASLLFLVGLIPFLLVLRVQIIDVARVPFLEAMWLYFTHAGVDFSPAIFGLSLEKLPVDAFYGAALTALQFASPAVLLAVYGVRAHVRSGMRDVGDDFWLCLFVFYLVDVLFASSYSVNDRYAFLLPGYLALALFAGVGWQAARESFSARLAGGKRLAAPHKAFTLALTLFVVMPLVVYSLTPRLLLALDLNPMQARTLPGREPNTFFIWPSKRDYMGAWQYGEATLATLPHGATLIADHTPIQTLKYLQVVEEMREDIRLVSIHAGDDLAPVVARAPHDAPIFLADSNPAYYNLRSIPDATLAARGPVFHLELPLN